jgi:hypothetical protein
VTLLCLVLCAQSTVTLSGNNLPAADALAAVLKQTGVATVLDLGRPAPPLTLDLRDVTAWHALDRIARQLDARMEHDRAAIRFVARRPGEPPQSPAYDGPFRVRAVRTQAGRDLLAGTGTCNVTLEVGWLPTLRPIFLDSTPHDLRVTDVRGNPMTVQAEAATLVPVEARPAVSLDVVLPAFPRTDTAIGKITGKLNAVVLGDMLTFDFDANLQALYAAPAAGAQRRMTTSRVTCSVLGVTLGRDRWTVKLALDYPAGANRDFESFQAGTMVVANELFLVSPDGKRQLVPTASAAEETGPRRTVVSFHFTDGPTGKRGTPSAWKVRYRAPSRILDSTLSFSFTKVPLP